MVLALALAATVPALSKLTAVDARRVRAKCSVPHSWVSYHDGALHITPPRGASDRKINCILSEATRNSPKRGFVGNEAIKP